jgi:hypothetical protein
VKLPVDCDANQREGLIEKCQIDTGIFVANSLTTVKNGYVVTSILNTNKQEVTVPEPRLKLAKFETMPMDKKEVTQGRKSRGKELLKKLRMEHLNSEGFNLPGDKLSSTNATRHEITLVPGTTPINTRSYRLPEAQKAEIEKQVDKLLEEGIIEKSNSPWNSPHA